MFQINPASDDDAKKKKEIRRKLQGGRGLGLFAKTLICIAIIDAFLWGYCTFVKKITLLEGFNNLTVYTRNALKAPIKTEPQHGANSKNIIYTTVTLNKVNTSVNKNTKSNIYKWKDKDGKIHFSNTNFPGNNETLEIIKDQRPFGRQTKFRLHGGTMLIPVEIENKGHKEEINLILDTGCAITQIHPDVVQRLKPRKIRKGKGWVADGREIDKTIYEVDSLKIGSIEEMNFTISTPDKLEHKRGTDGLLGMNFLGKHPFEIDKKAGVIIWE